MHRRTLLLAAALPVLAACSPTLGAFDAIAPRDPGARRVVRDAAYGEHSRQRIDLYAPRDAAGAPVVI